VNEVLAKIDDLTGPELDALPFGAIQLGREGTILQFNEYEANLSNRRAPETVGRNFFREVAPCTNVRAFHGVFREGVARGELHVTFDYRFEFRQAPRDVRVTLFYSAPTATTWVFVQERKST
jgi:photoactive yellow protein